ncbi:hypothetical protein SAMN05216420_10830 [Nitrosospira sp. Nl5]|nr:hypothetical protein SAMN05216420_10830 [Nitrosospira sp. Nl5]
MRYGKLHHMFIQFIISFLQIRQLTAHSSFIFQLGTMINKDFLYHLTFPYIVSSLQGQLPDSGL